MGFNLSSKWKPATLKTFASFSYIIQFALLRQVSKREGQIQSKFDKQKFFILPRIQYEVVLLVLRTVFAVIF